MLVPGLVAPSNRLAVREVLRLAADAKLQAVQWSTDGPVAVGDHAAATETRTLCQAAGVTSCSYASGYRAGSGATAGFREVLKTAHSLGARTVELRAGSCGSANASLADWSRTVHGLRDAVDAAGDLGIKIGLRLDRNTLADTVSSAHQLFREVSQDNLTASWQPHPEQAPAEAVTEFRALFPVLRTVHLPAPADGAHGTPFAELAVLWQPVLTAMADAGDTRHALLTVDPDATQHFRRHAETLRTWLT